MTESAEPGFFPRMVHSPSASGATAGWRERAHAVIPDGASTGSKRPSVLHGASPSDLPTHYRSASGCRVRTTEGVELVDCTMSLGAVAFGYADPEVDESVMRAVRDGNVAALAHPLEVVVAERLCSLIPCAERVRFHKSGAEAVAAAVRIARAHTGRDLVLGSGYFGWLDWCSTEPGVPLGVRSDFERLPFDDVDVLEDAVERAGDRLAAIVLEPVIESIASREWVETARDACDRTGAVLVLDEIKTGFRLASGGAQERLGVSPDLAVFGKAMANGYPLSAVVGRADVMSAASRTWISSTLAGETVALAAALAVLERHAREDVCASLWRLGERMMGAATAGLAEAGAGERVEVRGIPAMWMMEIDGDDEDRARFHAAAIDSGVLLKRGAYNFPALAHDPAALDAIAGAVGAAGRALMRSLA